MGFFVFRHVCGILLVTLGRRADLALDLSASWLIHREYVLD